MSVVSYVLNDYRESLYSGDYEWVVTGSTRVWVSSHSRQADGPTRGTNRESRAVPEAAKDWLVPFEDEESRKRVDRRGCGYGHRLGSHCCQLGCVGYRTCEQGGLIAYERYALMRAGKEKRVMDDGATDDGVVSLCSSTDRKRATMFGWRARRRHAPSWLGALSRVEARKGLRKEHGKSRYFTYQNRLMLRLSFQNCLHATPDR